MATLTVPTDARDEARFHEQIAQQHRAWVAYLTTHQQLLDVQATRSRVAFEYAESRDDEERTARATLASVPPALRTLFDAVVERERQELQRQLIAEQRPSASIDPDEAIRLALQGLRDDANGHTDSGRGLLPRGTPDDIRWYAVDTSVLEAIPTAATYATSTSATNPNRRLLMAGGATVLIVLLIIWMLVPKGTPAISGPQLVRVNLTPTALWPIETAILEISGTPQPVALAHVTTGAWPTNTTTGNTTPRGAIRTSNLYPLRLCIPDNLLGTAQALTLPAMADQPARRYILSAERPPTTPDLVVEPCTGDASKHRYGTLLAIIPLTDQSLAQAVTLSGERQLTVQAITLIGSGQDPTLPRGQARVVVQVTTTATLDWPTLAPTLLLPSGTALLPSETIPLTAGVELRYLVPAPVAPLPVAWSITPDTAQPVLRWRTTLPLPASRQTILRDSLAITDVHAEWAESPGTIRVTIQVINQGTAPLLLTPDTIHLSARDRVLGTPDPASLVAPLNVGERRDMVITAPEQPQLLLTIGIRRYAIQP